MLFNADIWQSCTLEKVNLEKQKISERKFEVHQKVENIKQTFTLILD